ncbi:siderophore ferric iron reductase [Photobacterium sp. 1_MG-2023]|uniref:siderophore ferric iron reductase n=1 Tax=Photobacterium sp. 1_MG-2023 TaxID=3062646 RepID=UPI0026E3A2C1|nr:siderophore ferric iron reductase [Photobacterium sp. 1_MG-2023]
MTTAMNTNQKPEQLALSSGMGASVPREHLIQLFSDSERLIPIMKGVPTPDILLSIRRDGNNDALLASLYQYWQQNYPEAGQPYWTTRSWSMLTWQPLYLAFVCVYSVKAVPPLGQIVQQYNQEGWVAGYSFSKNSAWCEGDTPKLIGCAGRELIELYEDLRQQMENHTRIRPGFTRQLLADSVLAVLLRYHNTLPDSLPADAVQQHAIWWLESLGLPAKHINTLYRSETDGSWQQMRVSCCMHYRRDDGKYCENCPKSKC